MPIRPALIAILATATTGLLGCHSVERALGDRLRTARQTEPDQAVDSQPPKIDARILKRKNIDPDSRAARRLAAEEENVRSLEEHDQSRGVAWGTSWGLGAHSQQ